MDPRWASGPATPAVSTPTTASELCDILHAVNGGFSTKQADKSCVQCRDRKVRCERGAPHCSKCRKRGENCTYPSDTNFGNPDSSRSHLVEAARIAELEAQLEILEARLAGSPRSASSDHSSPPISATPLISLPLPSLAEKIHAAVHSALDDGGLTMRRVVLDGFLEGKTKGSPGAGVSTPVGSDALGGEIVSLLVQAAFESRWSDLPAFKILRNLVQPYEPSHPEFDLEKLDPSAQVAIVVLCSFGARCATESALFGIPSTSPPTSQTLHAIGEQRHKVCRKLSGLAWDLAWQTKVFFSGEGARSGEPAAGETPEVVAERRREREKEKRRALGAFISMTELLTLQDGRPRQSRWLLRNAIEMYQDLQLDYPANDATLYELKRTIGPLLYETDGTISSRLCTPPLIPLAKIRDFLSDADPLAAHIISPGPVFVRLLDSIALQPSISKQDVDLSIFVATRWICSCERKFGRLSSSPNVPESLAETLASVQTLWSTIDTAHSSMQRLQNILATIPHTPPSAASPPWDSDHHVLLSVRLDARLLELCNLIHGFLGTRTGSGKAGEELEAMKMGSELGVRKGLKVLAFYSRLHLSSPDKYLGYQFFKQLDLLPDWTTLVTQRVGDVPGPPGPEFEVTDEELDWFTAGLEQACFCSSMPARRLKELNARRHALPTDPGFVQPPIYFSPETTPALASDSPPLDLSLYSSPFALEPYLNFGSDGSTSLQDFVDPQFCQVEGVNALRWQSAMDLVLTQQWDDQMRIDAGQGAVPPPGEQLPLYFSQDSGSGAMDFSGTKMDAEFGRWGSG